MSGRKSPSAPRADTEKLRMDWLARLSQLVDTIDAWAKELGWSTRRIEKRIEDSEIGPYVAPALVFQEDTSRILLEPIARSAPGTEGVVDLYLMPAWDDIATLYHYGGEWRLHYVFPYTAATATIRSSESKPLSKETFAEVLDEMKKHAAGAQ